MIPKSFTIENNVATFEYWDKDYNLWKDIGEKKGTSGPLLKTIDYNNKAFTYESFGVIESPNKERFTLTIIHDELLDGYLLPPEEYTKNINRTFGGTISLKLLDLSQYNNNPNIYKMNGINNSQFIADVAQFHKLFNAPILDAPQIPDEKRQDLRIALLKEEVQEFEDFTKINDLVEVADAFADTMYVLCGAILEYGLGDIFAEIFAEVQRSNMSKACTTKEEAIDTQTKYQNEGIETYWTAKEINGKVIYPIFRTSDDKVMKSINYSPADIKSIIDKYVNTRSKDKME